MSQRRSSRDLIATVALCLGSLGLSMIVADVALRFLGTRYTYVILENGSEITPSAARNERTTLFKPNLQVRYRADAPGREIFQVEYKTDRFGRRVTPFSGGERTKSLLVFGCSMAFGQAVDDSWTIPHAMGEILKDYEPYNYAVNGGGAQNLYAITTGTDFSQEVRQSEGVAIYLYYPYQLIRLSTHFSNLQNYYNSYEFREGRFKRLPVTLFSTLFQNLRNSPLFELAAGVFFPTPPPSEGDYELGARLFKESMDLYKRGFEKGDFVVVIVGPDEKMTRQLDKFEVPYVQVDELDPSLTYLPDDGHYTPEGNSEMASRIIRALRTRNPGL